MERQKVFKGITRARRCIMTCGSMNTALEQAAA